MRSLKQKTSHNTISTLKINNNCLISNGQCSNFPYSKTTFFFQCIWIKSIHCKWLIGLLKFINSLLFFFNFQGIHWRNLVICWLDLLWFQIPCSSNTSIFCTLGVVSFGVVSLFNTTFRVSYFHCLQMKTVVFGFHDTESHWWSLPRSTNLFSVGLIF